MILSIKVGDETYEKYGTHNKANPRGAIEQVVERFAEVGASGKAIVLNGETLSRLQKLIGQLDETEGLIDKVTKLVAVKVGDAYFPLSDSQIKGIKDRAAHQAQPFEAVLQREVNNALRNALGV